MGIVTIVKSGSAVVRIDDSCCRGLSAEEVKRRWDAVDSAIYRINREANRNDKYTEGGERA